jgi:hypothetical protein
MVRTFWDLEAWQLCDQLRRELEASIATPDVRRDGKFCDQIRGSIDSACANTAEGFGRYYPAEFRRFLAIARGSLTETQNHLTAPFPGNTCPRRISTGSSTWSREPSAPIPGCRNTYGNVVAWAILRAIVRRRPLNAMNPEPGTLNREPRTQNQPRTLNHEPHLEPCTLHPEPLGFVQVF